MTYFYYGGEGYMVDKKTISKPWELERIGKAWRNKYLTLVFFDLMTRIIMITILIHIFYI